MYVLLYVSPLQSHPHAFVNKQHNTVVPVYTCYEKLLQYKL